MDLQPYTVSIARGDGLVARTSDAVMYIADSPPTTDRLLAALDQTAGPGMRGPSIADRLASIAFSEDPAHISSFGVITSMAHQVRMILREKSSPRSRAARVCGTGPGTVRRRGSTRYCRTPCDELRSRSRPEHVLRHIHTPICVPAWCRAEGSS